MTLSFRTFVMQIERMCENQQNLTESSSVYNESDLDKMFLSYVETALWSSTGDNGEPLDNKFDIDNISDDSAEKMLDNCKTFVEKAGSSLNGLDPIRVGHDFWLTQNHHGAGFWDGDYEKSVGEKLTELSNGFKEQNLVIGDDGLLYLE